MAFTPFLAAVLLITIVAAQGDYGVLNAGSNLNLLGNQIAAPGPNNGIRFSFAVNETFAFWDAYACYGEYDYYIGLGSEPNVTSYYEKVPWNGLASNGRGFNFTGSGQVTDVYFLFVGLNTYTGGSAVFDFLFYTDNEAGSTTVPAPGNNGNTGRTLDSNGDSGSITWTPTGNPNDNYTVYTYNGKSFPDGDTIADACSITRFMTPLTSNVGTIKQNTDGTYTASFPNLNKNPLSTVVIVTRNIPYGYSVPYETQILNGVAVLVPSLFLMLVALFALV